ncbi:3-hydroxyacyl-CoA dehydrogenase NAD-binding domain-containing protein [Streptomyces sp. FXJ1.172]|uniref:3-hydroxyacyl-CoA dehydrogenase NAD-binding domain-containing protein n=1 Tax=Streptomyces sp. FXJ1.172 TaxID=710705 RepID=UPI002F3FF386
MENFAMHTLPAISRQHRSSPPSVSMAGPRAALKHFMQCRGATLTTRKESHTMNTANAESFRNVTIVGAGVIGMSWAALCLAHGCEVTISDPAPTTESQVRAGLADIAPTLEELGMRTDDLTARLRFEADLAAAVAHADVVQENGPERLEIKHRMWATIEENAPAHALFATSTSGLPASEIATVLRQPERLIVGHPFNPPHLVPLVEIVPGRLTSEETVEQARAFYSALGKKPQVLHKEVPGFVANRLQAAFFRECVHLVAEGVVTEQELDELVTSSIGPRWAVAGPFQSFHLGGGSGGFAHFLSHFAPAMEQSWKFLGSPTFDEATVKLLSEQAEAYLGDRPIEELATQRDQAQIALMRALGELPPAPTR